MVWHRGGLHCPQVAVAAAPVVPGIAIEHFVPHPCAGGSHLIVQTWDRREVANHQQRRLGRLPLAMKAHDTALGIVAIDPGKAARLAITLGEGGKLAVPGVQICDPFLDASMWSVFEQMPVQARLMIPLSALTKFCTHEEEFFARLGIHIAQ